MAVIRVCVFVFIAFSHSYILVLSKTLERTPSDSISTNTQSTTNTPPESVTTGTESSACTDPVAVLPCIMPLINALRNIDPTNMTNLLSVCNVYSTFIQCMSPLPENCRNETMSIIPKESLQKVELICGSNTGTGVCDMAAAYKCMESYTSAIDNLDSMSGFSRICGQWRTLKTCLNAVSGSCQNMLTALGIESQKDMMDGFCGAV